MPASGSSERDEVAESALAGVRDVTRMIGRRGIGFTPTQLDELIKATRTLMNALEFKLRLAGAVRS